MFINDEGLRDGHSRASGQESGLWRAGPGPLRADHTATRPALAGDAEGSQGRLPRGGGICIGFRREWDGTFWQWSRGSQGKGARSEVGGGTVGQEPQMGDLGGRGDSSSPPSDVAAAVRVPFSAHGGFEESGVPARLCRQLALDPAGDSEVRYELPRGWEEGGLG